MKKLGILIGVFGLFVLVGTASATTADQLQPASTITYNEELVVNDTGRFDSVYIGQQDEGGVTFFNGTIVNSTTTSTDDDAVGGPGQADVDNPVTFGDNVRVDGRIWRGANSGSGDDMPVIFLDDLEIQEDLTVTGSLSSTHSHDDSYYTETEVDALVSSGGHDHIAESWEGSVRANNTILAMLTLNNTGDGGGLVVGTVSSTYPAISAVSANSQALTGIAGGALAAVYGQNTSSGTGITGRSASGHGVYALSTSGNALHVDGRVGMQTGSGKSAGTSVISSGSPTVQVNNTAVTANSIILLTVGHAGSVAGSNTNSGIRLSARSVGASFTVATMDGNNASANIPFSYLIIN